MTRNNFTKSVMNQIVQRSKNERGEICCEGCSLVLVGKPYQIDHTKPDALRDKSAPAQKLTADDGQLLGFECCHKAKTAIDIKHIRKADRQGNYSNGVEQAHARQKPKQKIKGPVSQKQADPDRNKRDPYSDLPRSNLLARGFESPLKEPAHD